MQFQSCVKIKSLQIYLSGTTEPVLIKSVSLMTRTRMERSIQCNQQLIHLLVLDFKNQFGVPADYTIWHERVCSLLH